MCSKFKPSATFETGSWSSWSCQLCHAEPFLFYWPETAGCSLQTLQTLRNMRDRLLELPAVPRQDTPSLSFSTGPKLPQTLQTLQTGAWSCQLWQAKSFLFLLPCNCRMLPSNPRNLPTPATFGVDFILSSSWRSWSCQTATSFVFIGSTMPDASLKPSKPYTLKLAVCLHGCC